MIPTLTEFGDSNLASPISVTCQPSPVTAHIKAHLIYGQKQENWATFDQANGQQILQISIMKIKLLTFYKGPQFAINPLKSYMRPRVAFRADIFFKFDLENDF